jgi:hypothetical protein
MAILYFLLAFAADTSLLLCNKQIGLRMPYIKATTYVSLRFVK